MYREGLKTAAQAGQDADKLQYVLSSFWPRCDLISCRRHTD